MFTDIAWGIADGLLMKNKHLGNWISVAWNAYKLEGVDWILHFACSIYFRYIKSILNCHICHQIVRMGVLLNKMIIWNVKDNNLFL